ncbi:MAG: hypothetical protein ACE5KV_01745 [Thermoplasmata archaeon]
MGCVVAIEGNILKVKKGRSQLTLGFPSKENVNEIVERIVNEGGQSVLIPLFDDFSENSAEFKGIRVLRREEVEEDIVEVLFRKKRVEDTFLAGLILPSTDKGDNLCEPMVKPAIDIEDVVEIGEKTVRGFNYILELVPYFLFEYHSMTETDNGEVVESKGLIGVNALTKSPEVWEESFEIAEGLNYFDSKLEPKIGEREAFVIAQKKAIELGTLCEKTTRERNSTRVVEVREVRPAREDIQIDGKGLVYLPIWCVEGSKGSIIINAGTGKILREDLYS